jgi:hypothetical protein
MTVEEIPGDAPHVRLPVDWMSPLPPDEVNDIQRKAAEELSAGPRGMALRSCSFIEIGLTSRRSRPLWCFHR